MEPDRLLRSDQVFQGNPPLQGRRDHSLLDHWPDQPLFVIFFITLPSAVGLPHGWSLTIERPEKADWLQGIAWSPKEGMPYTLNDEGATFVSLKFWQAKRSRAVPTAEMDALSRVVEEVLGHSGQRPGVPSEPPPDVQTFTTVVEAVTPLLEAPADGWEAALSLAFDRATEEINAVVRAHMIATFDVEARFVTRHTVYPVVFWAVREPFGGAWFGPECFLPSESLRLFADPQAYDRIVWDKFWVAFNRHKALDPITSFIEWSRAARRAMQMDGDTGLAVLAAHTAGEVLLDSVLLLMAWEEGASSQEALGWFDEGLAKRVRTHYGHRLGNNWDTTTVITVPGRWVQDVTALRHRVVHGGYRPMDDEAERAIAVLLELEDFVKDRLVANRNSYPRTTLILLGREGLERRNLYRGKIKRFAEEFAESEPLWVEVYRAWLTAIPSIEIH